MYHPKAMPTKLGTIADRSFLAVNQIATNMDNNIGATIEGRTLSQ